MGQRVTVKVPVTMANLGPGFDCLGMALDIWNTITVEVGSTGFEISGYGPIGENNRLEVSLAS